MDQGLVVLLISDSLALPREQPEKVTLEETYFSMLQKANPEVNFIQLFMGGASLPFLYAQSSYYTAVNPDLIFVQSGVVDCAYRAFLKYEQAFLNKLKIKIPKKYLPKLRKYRNKRYTQPEAFRANVKSIQKLFGKDKLFWISIMPAILEWETVVPGISKSIDTYNEILKEEVGENLLAEDAKKEWIMSDFHHLNKIGQECIFHRINKRINAFQKYPAKNKQKQEC